ncbi:MAG: HAD-IA family hydrolase [Gammaproteobacteria bacterium]|nr:HAD-IA family hydrolase [Gammaproteobacteria bacterium]
MKALIFDCDGVLVDTERDGHRVAFNRTFSEFGLDAFWDVELYGELLKIAGGKERIRGYFESAGWPEDANKDVLVADLHKRKTAIFMEIISSGQLPLRSGIVRLVDEAAAAGVRLGVCTTSNALSVNGVLDLMGPERKQKFEFVLAGDVVSRKKPDPEIYNLAKARLGVPGASCMVIEDSRNGLLSALGAGMTCLITTSTYTVDEDFDGAAKVVPELGDAPNPVVTLSDLEALVAQRAA